MTEEVRNPYDTCTGGWAKPEAREGPGTTCPRGLRLRAKIDNAGGSLSAGSVNMPLSCPEPSAPHGTLLLASLFFLGCMQNPSLTERPKCKATIPGRLR